MRLLTQRSDRVDSRRVPRRNQDGGDGGREQHGHRGRAPGVERLAAHVGDLADDPHDARIIEPCKLPNGIRGHHQLAPCATPRVARAIGVHLNAEIVRILEVERLAHQVVRRPGTRANLGQMPNESAERRAIGPQHGKVVEPEPAAARCGPCTRPFDERHQ